MTDFRELCAELVDAIDASRPYATPLLDRGRAALAEPQSAADGEVAELVKWLREREGWMGERAMYSRAAELLERLSATGKSGLQVEPISVSERPWEREGWCDELGRCWLLLYPDDGVHLPNWKLDRPSHYDLPNGAFILPFHALPLPSGETSTHGESNV